MSTATINHLCQIIPPNLLIENCDRVPNQELRLAIIDVWQDKLKLLVEVAQERKDILKRSITLLLISGTMAILSKTIAAVFY